MAGTGDEGLKTLERVWNDLKDMTIAEVNETFTKVKKGIDGSNK